MVKHSKSGLLGAKAGFTLIELLVVVLIIGILAAVALPQYQKAVDKTRLMKLIAISNMIANIQETYYLTNGTYTTNWTQLDISLSGTIANEKLISKDGFQVTLTKTPEIVTPGHGSVNAVYLIDNQLPNITIVHFFHNNPKNHFRGILCAASPSDERSTKLCKELTNNQYGFGGGTIENPIIYWRFQ